MRIRMIRRIKRMVDQSSFRVKYVRVYGQVDVMFDEITETPRVITQHERMKPDDDKNVNEDDENEDEKEKEWADANEGLLPLIAFFLADPKTEAERSVFVQ